jgi:hypothetical protein
MSSCYITGHLPFLNSVVPDSARPKSIKSDTVLYIEEDTELEAQISSYQPTGALPDGTLAFVVAKLSGDGTSIPMLEVVNMTPFHGDDNQLPPFQSSIFAIGTVTRVFSDEKSFLLAGQEFIVSFCYCFFALDICLPCCQNHTHQTFVLYCKMAGPRFKNTPLPVQGRLLGIKGVIGGQQEDDHGPLKVYLDNITFIPGITIHSSEGSPSKSPKGPGYFKKRKRESEGGQSVNVDDDTLKDE